MLQSPQLPVAFIIMMGKSTRINSDWFTGRLIHQAELNLHVVSNRFLVLFSFLQSIQNCKLQNKTQLELVNFLWPWRLQRTHPYAAGWTALFHPDQFTACFAFTWWRREKWNIMQNIYIYMTIFPVPNFSCLLPIGMALFSSFSIALNYVLLVSCMTSYLWHRRSKLFSWIDSPRGSTDFTPQRILK